LLGRILGRTQSNVVTVASPLEGAFTLGSLGPNGTVALVLIDALQFGREGAKLIELMRKQPQVEKARFVLMSNVSAATLVQMQAEAGADDVLPTNNGILAMSKLLDAWLS
jgi:CheY-like chemotaxis protein